VILTPRGHLADLVFDEAEHRYSVRGGARMRSVTQILKDEGFFPYRGNPGPEATAGQWVHEMLRMHHKGNLDEGSISPVMAEILGRFREWANSVDLVVLDYERLLYHLTYWYGGKPDLIAMVRGRMEVIDYKSGARHPAHDVQVAGYVLLAKACYLELGPASSVAGRTMYLGNPAGIRTEPLGAREIHDASSVFLAALACNRWKERNNRMERRTE
jgi:hypothetical protein